MNKYSLDNINPGHVPEDRKVHNKRSVNEHKHTEMCDTVGPERKIKTPVMCWKTGRFIHWKTTVYEHNQT